MKLRSVTPSQETLVRIVASVVVVACALTACGGEALPPAESKPKASHDDAELPKGSLARGDVVRVVDAGLGQFLQRVQVEPSLEDGRFVGFRVLQLVPESFWRNADLRLGDVVTHVNETPIEDPNRAYAVFESLREAPVIKVRLLREGNEHELNFPIVGPPAPKPKKQEP